MGRMFLINLAPDLVMITSLVLVLQMMMYLTLVSKMVK